MKRALHLSLLFLLFSVFSFAQSFTGTKYIGAAGTAPGGGNPDYASLQAACDAINKGTITGDVTFYFTSDLTETDGIGLAFDPGSFKVTFKPLAGKTIKITFNGQADDNSGPSGAFVIGITNDNNIAWSDIKPTKNIIIDGSNSVNGTTRDLTFESATTSYRNSIPIVITGSATNITIKNCKIYHKSQTDNLSASGVNFNCALYVRAKNNNNVDYVPSNLTIENNHISGDWPLTVRRKSGLVFGYSGVATANPITGCVVKNNLIEGKNNAIVLDLVKDIDIYGNELKVNQDIVAGLQNSGILANNVAATGKVNIYSNKFSKISSANSADTTKPGNAGIRILSAGDYTIYNNMITGFNVTDSVKSSGLFLSAVEVNKAEAVVKLYHNSIYMNNPGFMAGMSNYRGLNILAGSVTYKNNILASTDKLKSYGKGVMVFWNSAAPLQADYNIYWIDNFAFFATMDFAVKVNGASWIYMGAIGEWWGTSSDGFEDHSEQKNPDFVSATDLHLKLNGSAIANAYFKGTPITGIITDIDGEYRSTIPYIGADEDPAHYFGSPLPVELSVFTAQQIGGKVILNWSTVTETNNRGFEIQRKSSDDWMTIGFVKGNGTTASQQSYSYEDSYQNMNSGAVTYRLKQIDMDGTASYSKSVEVSINSLPASYALNQNYPNPFNPSTKISFTLPVKSIVEIKVFDVTGKEINIITSKNYEGGSHSVDFNASGLASGMYIYKISAAGIDGTRFTNSKKMLILK